MRWWCQSGLVLKGLSVCVQKEEERWDEKASTSVVFFFSFPFFFLFHRWLKVQLTNSLLDSTRMALAQFLTMQRRSVPPARPSLSLKGTSQLALKDHQQVAAAIIVDALLLLLRGRVLGAVLALATISRRNSRRVYSYNVRSRST